VFTGIVEELGRVSSLVRDGDCAILTVRAAIIGADVRHGASIAVNGVCLTVVGSAVSSDPPAQSELSFDVMAETLARSVIGELQAGDVVNLERAVQVDGRLDGHVVQGHVDGTGVLASRTARESWHTVRITLPSELARYVAEKGAIAVDGISLTVTEVGPDYFEVGLIPETLRATTLGTKQPGDTVNLEVDVLAKYAERLLQQREVRVSPIMDAGRKSGPFGE
jgi:riboflavin synthase